jgi:hypothetical protein
VRQRLGGVDGTRAHEPGELHEQQPDRPAAEDADRHAEPQVAEIEGVQRDAQRFEHRAIRVGELVRQRVQAGRGPGDKLAQAAVERAVPGEAYGRAEIGVSATAQVAVLTGDGRVDRHALAVPRAALDNARHLVPDHQRLDQPGVADAGLGVPVQV